MSPPLPTESERNAHSRSGLQVWHRSTNKPIRSISRESAQVWRPCGTVATPLLRATERVTRRLLIVSLACPELGETVPVSL